MYHSHYCGEKVGLYFIEGKDVIPIIKEQSEGRETTLLIIQRKKYQFISSTGK